MLAALISSTTSESLVPVKPTITPLIVIAPGVSGALQSFG